MTFGQVKSAIEKNLVESYKNEKEFRKSLREFKQNVLNDKNFSKVYNLYDQLSTPQGLTESDSIDFLQEGISLIQKLVSNIKLPKTISEMNYNDYSDIDTLVYSNKLDLHERVKAKKNILSVLQRQKSSLKETINIPVKSMVKIANQTLENYISEMDQESKKMFVELLSSDSKKLQENFSELKEKTLGKLNEIMKRENESEVVEKLTETIEKLKSEEFNQMNYVKLVNLEKNL